MAGEGARLATIGPSQNCVFLPNELSSFLLLALLFLSSKQYKPALHLLSVCLAVAVIEFLAADAFELIGNVAPGSWQQADQYNSPSPSVSHPRRRIDE